MYPPGVTYSNGPGTVTLTSAGPGVPAGVRHEILVEFTIVTSVQVAPSSSTVVPLTKLTPMALILMVVPPVAGPAFGETSTNGAPNIVNPPGSVADPPTVVTVTSLGPALPAGVVQVIVVGVATTTLVQGFPPIKTVAEPSKFEPVIVIWVPPADGPDDGATPAIVGVLCR